MSMRQAETYTVEFHYDGFSIKVYDVPNDQPEDEWLDEDTVIERAKRILVERDLPTDADSSVVT